MVCKVSLIGSLKYGCPNSIWACYNYTVVVVVYTHTHKGVQRQLNLLAGISIGVLLFKALAIVIAVCCYWDLCAIVGEL